MGKKGLKFSRPSACRAVRRDAVRSLVEGEADWPKMAVPSDPWL